MATKEIVLITGGNTGLGLEIIKSLYKSSTPYDLIIGSRDISKGEAAIETVQKETTSRPSTISVVQVDISSDSSIEKAIEHISKTFGKLDVLINNAGANFGGEQRDGKLTLRELWNKTWDVNVAGTQVITTLAVPLLLKSSNARLIFMTSGTASASEQERTDHPVLARINGPPEAGWPKAPHPNPIDAYRSSKVGLNMMMRSWVQTLGNDGVKIWAISPGFLATGLNGIGVENLKKLGARDPSEGGDFTRDVVEGKRDADVGKAIRVDMVQPW